MEKRLTTTAMLFSVGFLFMLVCAVGAFFYGVQIGSEKIEAKYAAAKEAEGGISESATPYQQQDLVSFYLTVFSPYREFQSKWLSDMDALSRGGNLDAEAAFKSLAKLADKKVEESASFNMQKSPLLGEAQIAYVRSLKLFKDAATKAAAAKTKDKAAIYKNVLADSNYKAAVKEALEAQKDYYHAMQQWAATVDPKVPNTYKASGPLSADKWKGLPLTVKNSIVVNYLKERNELYEFYPHDLTSRVDDFIQSGQASKMKLQTANAIIDLLMNTRAVDPEDFSAIKGRLYESETLPQLPFFYPK
ncbi:hypothetical protein ACFQZE_02545 [Paenibacillus sp. GCM10027627]|uniref:hypothetical protein n=1 Tax=unclassified Paenibacillus TaxID=185978 RepID=UPI0036273DA7